MLEKLAEALYYYIIEAELLFLRKYKVNPFEIMKDISLLDLNTYVIAIQNKEKKEREMFRDKDLMEALRYINVILDMIFNKKT